MKRAILVPVVLLVNMMMMTNATANMYKWTDKNGEIHYTQTPPPPGTTGEDIEEQIRLSTGKLGNTIPAAADETPKDDLEQARREGEKSDQKHREFCIQQKDALQKMTANALIKWKDAQGERFLNAEEKIIKKKEIQKNIDSLCKPDMFNKTEKTTSQDEKTVDATLNANTVPASASRSTANTSGVNQNDDGLGSNATNEVATALLPATD